MTKETQKRRKKGEGSIYKKENGTYVGRITVAGYEPFFCTGTSRKEVEKKLNAFRLKTLKREIIPERVSVNDYISDWLVNVKKPSLKPASFDRLERTYLNHVKDSPVGRCQLGNVSAMDVQRLINSATENLSFSSVKKIYELLNSCFTYAIASRDLDYNPISAVQMPKKENLKKQTKEIRIFSREELEKIEKVSEIHYKSGKVRYKHAYFFILLANTGLRAGEALALTWENVDWKKRQIQVNKNASTIKNRDDDEAGKYKVIVTSVKTANGNRVIPLYDKALEALLWLKNYQTTNTIESEFVVCTDYGKMLGQKNLPHLLKTILAAAGVEYRNVHSFRHTFATNLIAAGVDVKVVSQLLGHSSVKITMDTYVHPGMDMAVDAVNRLN